MIRYAFVAFAALLSACASHEGRVVARETKPRAAVNVVMVRDVAYTPANRPQPLAADLYQPQGAGPFPAVVTIHGGGWNMRTRADMDRIAQAVAERGYVVMNVSYRFAPRWHFPAQL